MKLLRGRNLSRRTECKIAKQIRVNYQEELDQERK